MSRNESTSESLLIDFGNPDPPQGQIQITDDLLELNGSSNNKPSSEKGIIHIYIYTILKK